MELRHLRYFLAAVEEGSLHGAAERMNVAQPALSRRIRDLEETLGSKLFDRTAKGVTVTRAGAVLYREVLALLEGLERVSEEVRRLSREESGQVRLGVVQLSSKYPFLHEGIAAFGGLDGGVSFMRALSPELAQALREGRLDMTLLHERHLVSRGFEERLIHKERYVLAAHPDHRLARPGPLPLAELAGEPLVWLSRRESGDSHDALMQQCRLHGLDPLIGYAARSQGEQIEIAVTSKGACLTPASTVLSTPPGMLHFRPFRDFEMDLHLNLAWSRHHEGSPAARLLACLHEAITRHQADIVAGRTAWARMDGQAVVTAPAGEGPAA